MLPSSREAIQVKLRIMPRPAARTASAAAPARRMAGPAALTVLAAIGLAVTGLTACGQSTVSSGNGGGTAAGPAAGGPCHSSALAVSVRVGAAGTAAGSTFYPIDIRNRSAAACRMQGYPAAWLAAASGHRLGAPASPDKSVKAHPVLIRPGHSAHIWLRVGAAANLPPGRCHAVTSHWLVMLLPGGTARHVKLALPTCTAASAAQGLLMVQPVAAGRGRHGTAQ
jgi:Protein of unknown function (DUF4232)